MRARQTGSLSEHHRSRAMVVCAAEAPQRRGRAGDGRGRLVPASRSASARRCRRRSGWWIAGSPPACLLLPPARRRLERGRALPGRAARRVACCEATATTRWGLDPKRIGVLGFSAGGHLAGTMATSAAAYDFYPATDADDQPSRRSPTSPH